MERHDTAHEDNTMKCPSCDGKGKTGTYTWHTCYRCSGTGKVRAKKGKGK